MQANIFISHTTSDNRDLHLAHKLAVGLQNKGVIVWIAPDSIPTGERWEEHIVSGILEKCNCFLVILSAASIKAKWVLEEIKLAQKRQTGFPQFKIFPLVVGKIKTFPYSKFINQLQKLAYHDDFHAQLEALAQAIGLRPTVPDSVSAMVAEKTRDFVGRDYVFDAIDKFLKDYPNGYFIVEGDPGIGKSAILATFSQRTGCITHFNVRSQGITTARHFLENICSQLIARYALPYTGLPPGAVEDGAFLSRLLIEVGSLLQSQEHLIIAVDALDEADVTDRLGNILFLPADLPQHVYFILTRRQTALPLTVNAPAQLLDLMQYRDEGLKDVRTFINKHTETKPKLKEWIDLKGLDKEKFAEGLAQKSQGNFMYVRYILPDIENGLYKNLDIEGLPHGLESYYEDHWRRMGMMSKPLPKAKIRIVYILSVTMKPVSRSLITELANSADFRIDELEVQEILDEWDQFLREQREDNRMFYSVYHASFRDFLHRKDIVQAAGVTVEGIHKLIADELWEKLF